MVWERRCQHLIWACSGCLTVSPSSLHQTSDEQLVESFGLAFFGSQQGHEQGLTNRQDRTGAGQVKLAQDRSRGMEMGDAGKEKRRRGSAEVDCGSWDKGPEPVSVTRLGQIFFRLDQI
jgi:hypothetical protein